MDHAKFTFTMVPPSTPGPSLGLTPNLALSQDNYPTLANSNKRQRPDSDDEISNFTIFKPAENFARFLVVKSTDSEKPITSLSPFVIEKQIEATIGTPKSVKKLKNQTLLIETQRKTQTENLLKMTTFFNLPVTVSEHHTLNTSKGIIRDRALKGESEENIKEYLKDQGVIAVKRFTIKKGNSTIETNTLLLTFNMITVPKSLRIFYRFIPVDIYIPNPLRCFNCQKFNHHENNCPEDLGSVCENCGMGEYNHITSKCKNPPKCVNCGQDHISKSNECEAWKKEKEIMKIKVINNIPYIEARKMFEKQPDTSYSRIVQSAQNKKAETKTTGTQTNIKDTEVTASTKIIEPRKRTTPKTATQPKATSMTNSPPQTQKSLSQNEKSEKNTRESRPMSKTRPNNRKNSVSPKLGPKEKTVVKLTRVQDEHIKLSNKYGNLEQQMEEDPPPNN